MMEEWIDPYRIHWDVRGTALGWQLKWRTLTEATKTDTMVVRMFAADCVPRTWVFT